MSTELHTRIAAEVRSAISDVRTVHDPQKVADIVLGMPELQLIRAALNDMVSEDDLSVATDDDAVSFPDGAVERVLSWMRSGGHAMGAQQTEVNQGEIVLKGRIYRRVHGTWMVQQHLGPDFVPVIQALGDALDEIEQHRGR